jgi:hypothetical protein
MNNFFNVLTAMSTGRTARLACVATKCQVDWTGFNGEDPPPHLTKAAHSYQSVNSLGLKHASMYS